MSSRFSKRKLVEYNVGNIYYIHSQCLSTNWENVSEKKSVTITTVTIIGRNERR
jgi:hypothetical protein